MTINPDGTLTVPAATPAGVYPVEYRICEVANPANCDTAIASVTVSPVIDAVADDLSGSPILPSGGATPTVFANDTLNGAAFLPAAVILTIVADGGLTGVTINPDGTLTVPAATPAGSYSVEYRICEVANPPSAIRRSLRSRCRRSSTRSPTTCRARRSCPPAGRRRRCSPTTR
ncbi:MAG: hypothetical protein IPL47_12245 [Phyllobacteriaceae bacterium]|nr:hypothetical protein [Phyllobacteriaceae bacterium]